MTQSSQSQTKSGPQIVWYTNKSEIDTNVDLNTQVNQKRQYQQ